MIALETGIDGFEGLVEHQQPRRVDERAGEHDLLDHAGGVVRHDAAEGVRQVERAGEIGGAPLDDRRATARAARRSSRAAGDR